MRMYDIQEFITTKLISISISHTQLTGPPANSRNHRNSRNCPQGPRPFLHLNLCNFHNRFVQKKIAGQVSNYLYEFMNILLP